MILQSTFIICNNLSILLKVCYKYNPFFQPFTTWFKRITKLSSIFKCTSIVFIYLNVCQRVFSHPYESLLPFFHSFLHLFKKLLDMTAARFEAALAASNSEAEIDNRV